MGHREFSTSPKPAAMNFSKGAWCLISAGGHLVKTEMTKTTKRRLQIDVETHEITIIRSSGNRERHYCQNCRTTVFTFVPERLAEILKQGTDEIRRRVELQTLHFINGETRGAGLICGNSANGVSDALQTKTNRGEKL
jgi:hypothetical protein